MVGVIAGGEGVGGGCRSRPVGARASIWSPTYGPQAGFSICEIFGRLSGCPATIEYYAKLPAVVALCFDTSLLAYPAKNTVDQSEPDAHS
jgi:hypothetical protein